MLALVFVAGGLVPVPRTFLTLAAGVVYGMAAIPIIMPATTAGCLIAFLLARYLFAERLWRFVERKPKLTAIMNAVDAEGWRIVALCRLASPIPSTIQNALWLPPRPPSPLSLPPLYRKPHPPPRLHSGALAKLDFAITGGNAAAPTKNGRLMSSNDAESAEAAADLAGRGHGKRVFPNRSRAHPRRSPIGVRGARGAWRNVGAHPDVFSGEPPLLRVIPAWPKAPISRGDVGSSDSRR